MDQRVFGTVIVAFLLSNIVLSTTAVNAFDVGSVTTPSVDGLRCADEGQSCARCASEPPRTHLSLRDNASTTATRNLTNEYVWGTPEVWLCLGGLGAFVAVIAYLCYRPKKK